MPNHSAAQYKWHYTKNQSYFDVSACLPAFTHLQTTIAAVTGSQSHGLVQQL